MAKSARGRSHGGARRNPTVKFVSHHIQGAASWVSFRKPSWGEIRDATEDLRSKSRAMLDTSGGRAIPKKNVEIEEVEDSLTEFIWNLIVTKFDSWNWVDDDGNPLPDIHEMDMDDLMGDEVEFLMNAVRKMYKFTEDDEGN